MVDDEEPKSHDGREDQDEREDEDRDVILARRKLLVSAALACIAVPAEGCDWLQEKFGARSQPCLSPPPQVCLAAQIIEGDSGVAAQPTACLQIAPQACLMVTAPQPCLSTPPESCLRVARPPPDDDTSPQPCLSRPIPRTCLSIRRAPNKSGEPDKDGTDGNSNR